MTNWRQILSWDFYLPEVGQKVKVIVCSELLFLIGIMDHSPLSEGSVLDIHPDANFTY